MDPALLAKGMVPLMQAAHPLDRDFGGLSVHHPRLLIDRTSDEHAHPPLKPQSAAPACPQEVTIRGLKRQRRLEHVIAKMPRKLLNAFKALGPRAVSSLTRLTVTHGLNYNTVQQLAQKLEVGAMMRVHRSAPWITASP
jgi:hypothetical protein